MGIYLGANALGGGGGSQPGDLVAINQDGTATNDPTTNFIIDYNGGKYLRTGVTIPTASTSANTYPENILPTMVSGAVDSQLVGNENSVTSINNIVRSTVEIQAGTALTRLTSSGVNEGQFAQYLIPFGGDDTHIYSSFLNSVTAGRGLYITNKSTGAMTHHEFPFGSSIPAAFASSGRLSYVMGKGLLADKILVAFGNGATESGLMVINKSGTVDTSFNAGLFSSGVYKQTGSGASNPLYYGIAVNSNSKRWTGWMKVNPDAWASPDGALHISGSTSGNATIPSSNTFELRYVTIYGYVYPGGHYYAAIDHATGSLRSGIGLPQCQLAMQWTFENGSAGPATVSWSNTTYIDDFSYPGATPVGFGAQYDTASAAQAALDALNTANGTSYNSFPKAQMGQSNNQTTYTSNGSVESRVVSSFDWNLVDINETVGEPAVIGGLPPQRTRGVLAFDSASNDPSFWALIRITGFETVANPGVAITKMYLVEYPATVAKRNLSISGGAQGYVRPMYYDIRDQSVSFGAGGTGTTAGQRTTGAYPNKHHTSLVAGDKRNKFKFPIWVRLE